MRGMPANTWGGGLMLAGFGLLAAWAAGCAGLRSDARAAGPAGMVLVPAGVLQRGDATGVGYSDERPVRPVEVEGFWMDATEVTWEQWHCVFRWALAHGYAFDESYDWHSNRSGRHPVCNVSWHDAVKWCNARSEREGRVPAYWTDATQREVYRVGRNEVGVEAVRWDADGYRLPTEAEWEWAARGGLSGQHYPWPSVGPGFVGQLGGGLANYWESGDAWESDAECGTAPVGSFGGAGVPTGRSGANGYGLQDMTGNVAEWCWDWYLERWYEEDASALANARGPVGGHGRVLRGGSWISNPKYCRVSARYMSAPDYRCHCYGFRCVLRMRVGRTER